MFQGLTQGATIYLLYKNEPRIADGKVLSVNTHPYYNPSQPMAMMSGPVTDVTIQVGNDTIPFAGLPANGFIANFPDKGLLLSTDFSAILREIDSVISGIRQELSTIHEREKMLDGYEKLRMEHNPEKRMEVQNAKEMSELKAELAQMRKLLADTLGQKTKEEK